MAEPVWPAALLLTPAYRAQWPAPSELGGHVCGLVLPIGRCMQFLISDGAQNLALAVRVEGPDGCTQGSACVAWVLAVLGVPQPAI